MINLPPSVLVFSGNDPSGGAGMQADSEAISALKCRCAPIITATTEQNTQNVYNFTPLPASELLACARRIFADIPIKAIKIGMLGSVDNTMAMKTLLTEYNHLPVVLDPVLVATGGGALAEKNTIVALHQLLPHVSVITPNVEEREQLSGGEKNIHQCAQILTQKGAQHIVLTGGDDSTKNEVVNYYYHQGELIKTFRYPRLPYKFHGAGCTFASALSALLAQEKPMVDAITLAGKFTHATLQQAYAPGKGEPIPNRFIDFPLS